MLSNQNKPLVIIPEEHYKEVVRRLDEIREKYEPRRLEYDCEKLKEELINEFGVVSGRSVLVPGKRYGRLRYSPQATAVRRGSFIPYNGEIYIDVWWYTKEGFFYAKDAWGLISESKLPGCPLIEIV